MKLIFAAVGVLTLALLIIASCRAPVRPETEGLAQAPIRSVGHGAFFGPNGEELAIDADLIQEAQRYYIDALTNEARTAPETVDRAEIERIRELIYDRVEDDILANALFVDYLLETVQPDERAQISAVNNALRWHHFLYGLDRPRPQEDRWTKGIDPDTAAELEENGVPAIVFLKTSSGGEAYMRECREAGVPVPEAMFSDEWQLQGTFDREFISESSVAELWLHESDAPPGVCLALPRYPGGSCGSGDEACLLGIICLGTQSNKSCFFDNPKGQPFRRGVEVPLTEFVGGVDLVPNGQGVCSDCHAGENPFVVHPEKPAFASLPWLQPGGWPDPLVDASWPQNPGPTNLLDAVSSTGQCDSCHRVGSAGRFPDVSTALPGYCSVVLNTAAGTSVKRTMPPFGMDRNLFIPHINALQNACQAPPTGGGVIVDVDFSDDPSFVSPPMIIDPCYQCATKVAVRGAVLDAELEVFIDGTSVATRVARNPNFEEFDVPELTAGETITATQTVDGVTSAPSAPVVVRDHTVDYPAGLPAPGIDPVLIHECGDIIAVRHVPGALLTVFSNGTDPRSFGTSTDWTAVHPAKRPFAIGDEFTATARLCTDESGVSDPESAVTAPPSLPALTLNPASIYVGQELVTIENITYGARVNMEEDGTGTVADFTWPVSWFPDYDVASKLGRPLNSGDLLVSSQTLCTSGPLAETTDVIDCRELPAPVIHHPLVGQNYVVVTESVPGARIHVYDDTGDELGDGSGTVIMLKRTLTGADILTVVQQVGECTSRTGYRVSVRNVRERQQDET
jgi:hypothetical protein